MGTLNITVWSMMVADEADALVQRVETTDGDEILVKVAFVSAASGTSLELLNDRVISDENGYQAREHGTLRVAVSNEAYLTARHVVVVADASPRPPTVTARVFAGRPIAPDRLELLIGEREVHDPPPPESTTRDDAMDDDVGIITSPLATAAEAATAAAAAAGAMDPEDVTAANRLAKHGVDLFFLNRIAEADALFAYVVRVMPNNS